MNQVSPVVRLVIECQLGGDWQQNPPVRVSGPLGNPFLCKAMMGEAARVIDRMAIERELGIKKSNIVIPEIQVSGPGGR
jgi:hypothetical protein